jgi:hypothetical protein
MTLSGPGDLGGGMGVGFLGPEALGDTTIELTYSGGAFTVHDALYDVGKERFLDLLAFRVERPDDARPRIAALLEYVATDVMPSSAVLFAVAVPTAAVGDSVARMLSPGYYDALRCESGLAGSAARDGLRFFYGPEARIYCRSAAVEGRDFGPWIRADLVMGRR